MQAFLDNLPLKLASVALAVLLWFAIAGEKTSEMGVMAPLELQNFPRDLELTGDAVNQVEVRVRASPGIIQRLGPADISAQVDLAGYGEGEHIIHLTAESIRTPFGVRVVKISPSIITLNVERTLLKTVPIRPRLVGTPAPGYEVTEVVSEPPEIRLAGPKSRVQQMESAFTEPVSVEKAETSVAEHVNIGVQDALLRIQGSPRVRVTARIREIQETRTFASLDLAVRGGAGTPRPARVAVTLAGPASVLRRVVASDVRPYVDVTRLDQGWRAPVAVELAAGHPGVTVLRTEPGEVVLASPRKGARASDGPSR